MSEDFHNAIFLMESRGTSFVFRKLRVLLYDDESDEYVETGKAACQNCLTLLTVSDGDHVRRHVKERCKRRKRVVENTENEKEEEPVFKNRKISEYSTKKLKESDLTKIYKALSKYCLRTGRSFNHMNSDAMKSLMMDIFNTTSSGYGEAALKQLPHRSTIQAHSEALSKDLVEKSLRYMEPYKGEINLAIQIVPVGFTPALEGKTGRDTANSILQKLQSLGWSREDVLRCNVTGDGALSTFVIRCVNHSLNLVASRVVSPLKVHRPRLVDFTSELQKAEEILALAGDVAVAVRSNNAICASLPRLPALKCETRWMSSAECLSDVLDLLEDIQKCSGLSAKGRSALNLLTDDHPKRARALLHILKPLLAHNKVFQSQSAVTLHLVLPTYKHLEITWTEYAKERFEDIDEDLIDVEMLRALSESGLLAVQHYYREFEEVHFAAVMLSPFTKRMSNFSKEEFDKAKLYIVNRLPAIPPATVPIQDDPSDPIAALLKKVQDSAVLVPKSDDLERYLGEHFDGSGQESLEQFWRGKKNEFPALYKVATQVFSVVPSESMCESSFPRAAFLLDKTRSRLAYTKAEIVVVGAQLATKFPDWLN
ncbi:Protein CBG21088 [Caenorhabditis briggsae]|uniref:Protein CBG21088 n=1 Tax=Caenorhabditis briggsae TaxID=6238 RepID=A8XZI1_CAEBR|nr:Protein CBG21088 [Caenorhabditis briggsae]CAP38108.2 Protein CBG21088 [Caenorhabditis briggsae]